MRRRFSLICCLVSCLLLTGCWSSIEINERAFVAGIFVDLTDDNQVELTISSLLPNRMASESLGQAQPQGAPYATATKTGPNLEEALKRIQRDLTRRISWGHTRIVVISDRYARQGITSLLEWITRQPSFHLKTAILVAPGKARNIPELVPVYEHSPVEVLRKFTNQHYVLSTTIREILMGHFANQDTAITSLTFQKSKMVSEGGEADTWVGTDGAALFQKNRLVGKISPREAMMLAWVRNKLINPSLLVYHGKHKQKIGLRFEENKADIRPMIEGDRVVFHIHLYGDGSITSAETKENLLHAKVIHQIEKEASDQLRRDLLSALKASQRVESDALQLGSRIEWWYPDLWKQIKPDWRRYYRTKVSFKIEPQIFIRHYGSETNSVFNIKQ